MTDVTRSRLRLPRFSVRLLLVSMALAACTVGLVSLVVRFDVLLDTAMNMLFWLEEGPPSDVDAVRIRPRLGFYLVLAAILAAVGYGLRKLIGSYREDRRRIDENAVRIRAEIEAHDDR